MLRCDAGRAFSIGPFCMAGILFLLVGGFSNVDKIQAVLETAQPLEAGWTVSFVSETLKKEAFLLMIPFLSALPFSASFVEEWQSGMIRLLAGRVDKDSYLFSKAIATALSGGLILVFGALLLTAGALLAFLPLEKGEMEPALLEEGVRDLSMLVLRYFLCGALWAEVGLLCSAWLNHRYLAYLSPFMADYLLVILHERYVDNLDLLYPKEWILANEPWPWDGWSLTVWLLALSTLAGAAFITIGKERLNCV